MAEEMTRRERELLARLEAIEARLELWNDPMSKLDEWADALGREILDRLERIEAVHAVLTAGLDSQAAEVEALGISETLGLPRLERGEPEGR